MSVVFTDFWSFVAFIITLVVVGCIIEGCIKAWKGKDE